MTETVTAAGQHRREDQGGYITPNGFKSKLLANARDYSFQMRISHGFNCSKCEGE